MASTWQFLVWHNQIQGRAQKLGHLEWPFKQTRLLSLNETQLLLVHSDWLLLLQN